MLQNSLYEYFRDRRSSLSLMLLTHLIDFGFVISRNNQHLQTRHFSMPNINTLLHLYFKTQNQILPLQEQTILCGTSNQPRDQLISSQSQYLFVCQSLQPCWVAGCIYVKYRLYLKSGFCESLKNAKY